jgi:hypothetical protein
MRGYTQMSVHYLVQYAATMDDGRRFLSITESAVGVSENKFIVHHQDLRGVCTCLIAGVNSTQKSGNRCSDCFLRKWVNTISVPSHQILRQQISDSLHKT